MSRKHTAIMIQVMSDWTVQGRGRLYIMTQGTFRAMYSDAIIRVSPFPKKSKMAFPDLFGFELLNGVPIFTVIEIKTRGDQVKPGQKLFLSWVKTQGAKAYVAWEDESKLDGYRLEEWR